MVSRLSSDHVKHDNRIEVVCLQKVSFLNKHLPPDKESAAEEYTLGSNIVWHSSTADAPVIGLL